MNKVIVHNLEVLVINGVHHPWSWDAYEMIGKHVEVEDPIGAASQILAGSTYSHLTLVDNRKD